MVCLFGWFGVLSVIVVAVQIVRRVIPWFYENLVGPFILGPKINLKSYGEWAVVTGATDGIGKAYAKQLAKQGLNVALISRTQSKLETVAAEIAAKYNVQTKVIAVDFTSPIGIFNVIQEQICSLKIGVLVNNVGMSYSNPEYFHSIPDQEKFLADLVNCNVVSVTNLCKIVLPSMLARKQGVIINIASMSATIPNPMLTVYSASKAFVDKFSEDLSSEYSKDGIIIQSVLPGFVATNMTRMKSSLMVPDADTYAEAALRTIGYARHTTGYFPHAVMQLGINTVHSLAPEFSNGVVLNNMEKARARASRKSKTQ